MIEIIFQDGELFRSANGKKWLRENYVIMTGLPRQIVITGNNNSSYMFLEQIASISEMISSGSKAMTYIVIGNIALQLFM